MALPPVHRYTHDPEFIAIIDSAWDNQKLRRDEALILAHIERDDAPVPTDGTIPEPLADCPWPSLDHHPVRRYHRGTSRFDVKTIQPWLLPDVEPVRFVLRRLDFEEYRHVKQLRNQRMMVEAAYYCLLHGIRRVVGCPGLPEWPGRDTEPPAELTDRQINTLRTLVGDGVLEACAAAIFIVSMEVTSEEKKA